MKWKCSHRCGSVSSPFRKVHSEVPSKAAVLQHQGKSSSKGEVGARHLLLEEQFAVERTKMQIRNQSISPLNSLGIYNSLKRSRSLRTRREACKSIYCFLLWRGVVDLQVQCRNLRNKPLTRKHQARPGKQPLDVRFNWFYICFYCEHSVDN